MFSNKGLLNASSRTQPRSSRTNTNTIMSEYTNSDGDNDTEIIFSFVSRALELITNGEIMVPNSTPASPRISPTTIEVDPQAIRNSSRIARSTQHPPLLLPAIVPRKVEKSSSSLHHCGQFTFYFPRCSHATSHLFHLNTWSGTVCNKNCVYDQGNDYWFYADEGSHCSYCGLGEIFGIGAKQSIPEETEGGGKARESFFERLVRSGKLCAGSADEEAQHEHNEYYLHAVLQYNRLIDAVPPPVSNPIILSLAQQRTKRRGRMLDRWDIRRLRARRRTEDWVRNIRTEQYDKTKSHVEVGSRPYIVTPTGNPHMDLYTEVPLKSLPTPIDNCAWCQFGLSSPEAVTESGGPSSLPCGHTFHYNCIVELFEKRTKAGERERHKCPLCSVWFRDVREIPDFYGRYRDKEHGFRSDDESSVLSGSEVGDLKGHVGPPWLEEWVTDDGETVDDGDEESELDSIHTVIEEEDSKDMEENCSTATEQSISDNQEPLDTASFPQTINAMNHSRNEEMSAQQPPSQNHLHVGQDRQELDDAYQEGGLEGLSYIVTLQLPSPRIQRRTSRRRRRPRRLADECGWGSRRRRRGHRRMNEM